MTWEMRDAVMESWTVGFAAAKDFVMRFCNV
jgi:hypothetical protein